MSTTRSFYRCPSCLSVVAVDQPSIRTGEYQRPECSICNRSLDWMGFVQAERLGYNVQRPPCDARCTNATGPNCECTCKGVNHGSGKLVTVWRDTGGVPKITPPDTEAAARRRDEYLEAKRQVDERLRTAFGSEVLSDFKAGNRLPYTQWNQLHQIQQQYAGARALRTHTGRLKALAKIQPPRLTR